MVLPLQQEIKFWFNFLETMKWEDFFKDEGILSETDFTQYNKCNLEVVSVN